MILFALSNRASFARVQTVIEAMEPGRRGLLGFGSMPLGIPAPAQFVEVEGFKFDALIRTVVDGDQHGAMADTLGLSTIRIVQELERLKPNIVVTVADRFETLATAIAASYMNIPLAHIQGGEVTGTIDDKVRNAVTQLADFHFPSTAQAAQRIARMLDRGHNNPIFNYGCPSIDLIPEKEGFDGYIYQLWGPGVRLETPYIVVMFHPDTTCGLDPLDQIKPLHSAVWRFQNMNPQFKVLWFYPNMDSGSDEIAKFLRQTMWDLNLYSHMPHQEFYHLLHHAHMLIGNSSCGIRECSYMGVPVVNVGDRQKGRLHGKNVTSVGLNEEEIYHTLVDKHLNRHQYKPEFIYGDGNAGPKIANKLMEIEDAILASRTIRD